MIVGTEGIHTLASTGYAINDRSAYPHFRLQSISGMRTTGDFDPPADRAIGRPGEVARAGERAGKNTTFEGILIAKAIDDLRDEAEDLLAACFTTEVFKVTSAPHPGWDGPALPTRYWHARIAEADPREEPQRRRHFYESPVTVTFRLDDPRVYDVAEQDVSSTDLVPSEGIPWPVQPNTGTPAASPSDEQIEVEVEQGSAPGDAIIELRGPMRNPVLINDTTGGFLRFRKLDIDAEETVTIDFRRRRVTRPGGENIRHTIGPRSTWFTRGTPCLAPGTNDLRVRSWAFGNDARLRVRFNRAYPA